MTDPTRAERALVAVAAQFFANGALMASFAARGPQIRDRIGVGLDRFGLLLTTAALIGLVASTIAGRVIHAVTTRRVLRGASVMMVAALPVIGAANRPAVWLIGMLAFTFADVFADIAMNLQGSWISARRSVPVMHRLHGLWSLGTFAGGLGAVAANAAGVSPFVHLSVVAAVVAVGLATVTRRLLADDAAAGHPDAPAAAATHAPPRTRSLAVALLSLAGMFAVVGEVVGGDWATFRLTDDLGAAAAVGSLAFVAFTVGMTAMRFGGDLLQLRLGRDRLHRISCGLATAGFVVATLVPTRAAAIAGFALVGIGVATFMPKLYDDAARVPGRRGAGLGALTAGMRVAFLSVPVGVGALAGTSLSVGEALAIFALPAMVGLVVVSEWARISLQRATPAN